MHIQIINFNLKDLSRHDYEGSCNEIAQAFADLPGLQSKHWLADEENNTYGGVYIWESREAMQRYLESELFSQVASNPAFENVSSKDFEILEGPTRATRGLE
ncbi:MAG: YdhR family protein [Verrucomicrobia bacterium]|nr:YdhR family protein [Verrucomicrobiota bacterium]